MVHCLSLISLVFCMPLTLCVKTEDVIGCISSSTNYQCCRKMKTDTLPSLDITYDCSSPDNVTIIPPSGTNQTSAFRLFHSNLCLTRLPQNICDYPNIVSIQIVKSSLNSIPSLSCLKDLIALDLSHNRIESLKKDSFLGLSRLRYINLRYNRISHIEPHTFRDDLHGLMIVMLDVNRLTKTEVWPMSIKHDFCYFGLSHNKIEKFSNEENWQVDLAANYGPGMVDFSYNQFQTWVTEQLKMYGIHDLRTLGKFINWGFDFRNNPWRCDCKMHEFLKLASNLPQVIWRNYFEVHCQSPTNLKGTQIIDVPLIELVCNLTEKCPEGCLCQDQPENDQILVDCRDGELTRLPLDLPDGNLKLILSNNSITSVEARSYLKRTRYMDISKNGLEYLSADAVGQLQQTIESLNLSDNNLRYLPEVIQNIPFSRLLLDRNSFICSCNSTWMFRWLKQQTAVSGIMCSMSDGGLREAVTADDEVLECHVGSPIPTVLSVILGVLAALFIVTVILLVVFRYEAVVLLHQTMKKLQKPGDDIMDQDVFVSLEEESEMDRVWAVKTLLPELEQKHNLKLYFPLRDMDPGTVIVDETIKALKKSHTALIILSNTYLENSAKIFEFSEAYKIMVSQRSGQLIIIRSSDITKCPQAYMNAFIRLKKYVDRDDVDLFERIVKIVEKEKQR